LKEEIAGLKKQIAGRDDTQPAGLQQQLDEPQPATAASWSDGPYFASQTPMEGSAAAAVASRKSQARVATSGTPISQVPSAATTWEFSQDHKSLVVISDEHRLVYVDVPKAASTTIRLGLSQLKASALCSDGSWAKHASPKCCTEGQKITTTECLTQKHLDEYFIFSFSRHPVDKFESAVRQFWLQQEKRNETLGQPLQATAAQLLARQLAASKLDPASPQPNWVNVHFESSAYRLAGRTSLGKPVPLDFVGRIEHMAEDWKAAAIGHCAKLRLHPSKASAHACGGLELLALKAEQVHSRRGSPSKFVNLVESDSLLDTQNVQRFCESGLYGPALQKPVKWFGMPWYNCTDPNGPRETNALRSFRLEVQSRG